MIERDRDPPNPVPMSADGAPEFSWQEFVATAVRALDDVSRRVSASLVQVFTSAETWTAAARPVLEGIGRAALKFRDAYDEGVPSGWQLLDTAQMLAVIELMAATGWCLTTSPPAETLITLFAASDNERGQVLLDAEPRILDDLDLELRSMKNDRMPMYASAAREAWEAHASGLYIASQAASTVTLSALSDARGPLAMKSLGAARSRLEQLKVEDAGLREIRFYAVSGAVAKALSTFPATAPEPRVFNRHASAHALSAHQYTQLNSLTALMLACGWLREVQWLVTQVQPADG